GKAPATTSKTVVTCFGCGEMGHYKNKCHKKKGQQVTGKETIISDEERAPQCDGGMISAECDATVLLLGSGKETIISDEERAPQCDGGMISAEVTNLKNESSKEVPHLEDQNGDAVTSPIESITAPHLEEQTTPMITDDVNDAQQKEPRLDVPVIRPRSSSPAVEVNEGNKRPANICDSPATEVNEENKRQAVICSFFANGWCIKGNSCKFRHIKDHTSVSDQQKETSVAAYQRSEPQNDEGLANSAAAPSITCSSEVKPELQKENIVTIPSVNDAGT
nr:protein FRIGIDA-ESSENTIAL 1-like isoform X1 [Tanacetum cinerariifolium]